MNVHEFQAKSLFAQFGVPVPRGEAADTPAQAREIATRLGGRVVVKAQIHTTDLLTSEIVKTAENTYWDVQLGLANELAPERTVLSLDQFGCLCSTMFRVSPNHLLWILEELVDGRVHNQIVVPDDQKRWTRVALDRMLSIQ